MDGKLTTPAALNGDVRTIPLIDKTLTIEGKCADAKATGDRFDAQAAIIEEHGIKIADNAALIQALRAENGMQDTTLGEHKILIEGNDQKIAAAENNIGELERKASEAETAIGALQEKATTTDETLAELNAGLSESKGKIDRIGEALSGDYNALLNAAVDDIEVLKENVEDVRLQFSSVLTPYTHLIVSSHLLAADHTTCMTAGGLCTVFFNFSINDQSNQQDSLYSQLPPPLERIDFYVYNVTEKQIADLFLYNTGEVFVSTSALTAGRYVGHITYVMG